MDGITIICPVICPYCGATIKPDYRFCMVCGLILEAFFSECRDCGDRGHHWFYGDKEKLYCSQCGSRRIIHPPAEVLNRLYQKIASMDDRRPDRSEDFLRRSR